MEKCKNLSNPILKIIMLIFSPMMIFFLMFGFIGGGIIYFLNKLVLGEEIYDFSKEYFSGGGQNDIHEIINNINNLNAEDKKVFYNTIKSIMNGNGKKITGIEKIVNIYNNIFQKCSVKQKEMLNKTIKDIININKNILGKLDNKSNINIKNICVNGTTIKGVRKHKKCNKNDYKKENVDVKFIKKILKKIDNISEKINIEGNIEFQLIEILTKEKGEKGEED